MRRGFLRITITAACLVVAVAPALSAQGFRGAIQDSATHQPIAGAVVMLLDSSGATLGRNITNELGEYHLARPSGARWLRVVRIGFQPREIRMPAAGGEAPSIDVAMVPFSTVLASVHVADKSRCPRRSDGAMTAARWEQARAGLLATVVAREANPATVHRLAFERTMDGNSDRITRFLVSADSASGVGKSFTAALSARDFVTSGFAADSAGTQLVYGPDAEVLLDDAFAGGYCFRSAEPVSTRPRQVGLAFAPADRVRGRVDIDGTLWVDTAARTLKDIEFRYLGLPGLADAYHPGGWISFRQMSNGLVLIDRWYLRRVDATQDTVNYGDGPKAIAWLYATENGGELARATWPDGQTWHANLSAVHIHAVTSNGHAAVGAVVALPGTPYRGTADSAGDISIADLVPGPYSVQVIEPRMAELRLPIATPLKFIAVRDSIIRTALGVRSAEEYTKDKCLAARQYAVGDSVLILGRVVTTGGMPLGDAKVTFAVKMKNGRWNFRSEFYTTGTDGIFQLCTHHFDLGNTVMIRVHHSAVGTMDVTRMISTNLTIVRIPVAVQLQEQRRP